LKSRSIEDKIRIDNKSVPSVVKHTPSIRSSGRAAIFIVEEDEH